LLAFSFATLLLLSHSLHNSACRSQDARGEDLVVQVSLTPAFMFIFQGFAFWRRFFYFNAGCFQAFQT